MLDETAGRKEAGDELLKDHLKKVEGQAELFLAALSGFRRDLGQSLTACEGHLAAVFTGAIDMLVVPPLHAGTGFADLGTMLGFAEDALDGDIAVKNPRKGKDDSEKESLLEELELAHKNLTDVSDTAHRLYQSIQAAGYEFDVFNTKNIEAQYTEANILFDRDALNVSMATARALGERAVRLDIDLMESKQRLESGEKQAKKK
jgi:hypothetical protein